MLFLLSAAAVISLHFMRRATMTLRDDLDMADQAQLPENGTNKQDNRGGEEAPPEYKAINNSAGACDREGD
jgi:hypothetical protein